MDFLNAIQIAGLCLMLGAAAFLVVNARRTIRQAGRPDLRVADPRSGWRLDVLMAMVWSAMLLVQLPSIVRHLPPPATYHLSWLSLSSIASVIFVCGGFAGRLVGSRDVARQKVCSSLAQLGRQLPAV